MRTLYEEKDNLGSVTDVDRKGRQVSGYLADFDSLDRTGDIIVSGSFSKSLRERKDSILFLNQHNWSQPHGFFAELREDTKGLFFVSNPLTGASYSNDAIELYDAGILTQHSIGFTPVKWDWDKDQEVRTLKEIKLFEGSNVTVGANPNTPYLGRKAWSLQEINDQVKRITKALRQGNLQDETYLGLEIALKQLQSESYRRGQADALSTPGPGPTAKPQDSTLTAISIFTQSLKV